MRQSATVLFSLLLVAIVHGTAHAIPDNNNTWDGWTNGSSEDDKDSLGLPDVFSWDFTVNNNVLESIQFDYNRGNPTYNNKTYGWITTAWGLLQPGDLFIDIVTQGQSNTAWDYVFVQQESHVSGRTDGANTLSGVTPGLYQFSSPLDVTPAGTFGAVDYPYMVTTADPGPWGGGWNIRDHHAWALKNMSLVSQVSGDNSSFSWDRLGDISLGTVGQALFGGLGISLDPNTVEGIHIGFAFNCANDVVYDGTSVPLESVPEPGTLLLMSSGLAGVLLRRRVTGRLGRQKSTGSEVSM